MDRSSSLSGVRGTEGGGRIRELAGEERGDPWVQSLTIVLLLSDSFAL